MTSAELRYIADLMSGAGYTGHPDDVQTLRAAAARLDEAEEIIREGVTLHDALRTEIARLTNENVQLRTVARQNGFNAVL